MRIRFIKIFIRITISLSENYEISSVTKKRWKRVGLEDNFEFKFESLINSDMNNDEIINNYIRAFTPSILLKSLALIAKQFEG
jgi:hypothetical protein